MKVKVRKSSSVKLDPIDQAPVLASSLPHVPKPPSPNRRKNTNVLKLIRERLADQPLTRSGKLRDTSLADEVAHTLIEDARNGKYQAVQLLIQASESNIVRQRYVNYIINRIYYIVARHFETDSPVFEEIARDLYQIKHRVGNHSHWRTRPIYTNPDELEYEFHEDLDVAADLSKGRPGQFKYV